MTDKPQRRVAAAGAARGDNEQRRQVGRRGEKPGPQVERHFEVVAEALEFHQAIGLALRCALRQRQSARDGKHPAEIDRLDLDHGAMAFRHVGKARMAEVGPG